MEGSYKSENGETRAQMKHARELKALKSDDSVDQQWTVHRILRINDCYVYATTVFWLLLKATLFLPLTFLAALPLCIVARCYGACLKTPTDEVRSSRYCLLLFCLPLVLLFAFVALLAFLLDVLVHYLLSLPFFLLRLLCGGCCYVQLCSSWAAIWPHGYGPFVFTHVTDLLVALVGQVLRQGVLESSYRCSVMVTAVPWMKYYIAANPWIYNLDERFVQQISTSMRDLPPGDVSLTARRVISRTKQEPGLRKRQDLWRFMPHYPYPPEGRNYALGLQAVGSGVMSFFLVVHATHALEVGGQKQRDPDWLTLSNSAMSPTYRVMLWYNNPYHIYTGFVEASMSTGAPSQTDKSGGGEHPMWLVAAHSPMLSSRTGICNPGQVDRFFDRWLPTFVDELRRLLKGDAYAQEMHEEVISKDGISRPAGRKEVKKCEEA